jgi:hypothetical protein
MYGPNDPIQLDFLHRAFREKNNWVIERIKPNGGWDTLARWSGNRKSIYTYCETHDIAPSRGAEQIIDSLSEQPDFRADPPKLSTKTA